MDMIAARGDAAGETAAVVSVDPIAWLLAPKPVDNGGSGHL